MNRRKAIGRIILAGLGGGILFSGYKWYDWNKRPELASLGQHKKLIEALASTIIPTTDTPGAKEAGVADYIITMIRDCTNWMSANRFINGLTEVDHYSRNQYNRPYEACTEQEQETILQHFEKTDQPFKGLAGRAEVKFLGKPFFTTLKEYTIQGYCTSEAGATKGLSYVLIPGSYHGCITKTPGQPAWATK